VIDKNGVIDYISNYVEDILHFKQVDLLGSNIFEITEPDSVNPLKALFASEMHLINKPVYFTNIGLHCSFCFKHFFDGIMQQKETPAGMRYVLYLHDVTDRKTEAEKLSLLNLELDSFIYKASHDLRSPLLSISGLLNLMEKTIPGEYTEYTLLMRRSLSRLDQFITQLANYARNNNAQQQQSRINFSQLFGEVIETYRFLPNAEKIKFYIDVENAIDTCSDNFRLKIILNNLISNAIKYHNLDQKDPFIKISIQGNENEFIISVSDNGMGIPSENIDKIFGMFKRATEKADGSGLGLYIVKKALDKLNGQIEVKSEINIGTTFTIRVPHGAENCDAEHADTLVKMSL
jgi:signal transduction histidine kinase